MNNRICQLVGESDCDRSLTTGPYGGDICWPDCDVSIFSQTNTLAPLTLAPYTPALRNLVAIVHPQHSGSLRHTGCKDSEAADSGKLKRGSRLSIESPGSETMVRRNASGPRAGLKRVLAVKPRDGGHFQTQRNIKNQRAVSN